MIDNSSKNLLILEIIAKKDWMVDSSRSKRINKNLFKFQKLKKP